MSSVSLPHNPLAGISFLPAERHVYSVTQLTADLRLILEDSFAEITVEGEVTGLRTPTSGHHYFTLKDGQAQLRAVCFRSRYGSPSSTVIKEGDQVVCSGRISVYEPRGEYQLIVSEIEPQGRGALWRAFLRLRDKLEAEGLFAVERKRAIPLLPRTVAVVTSASGAAIRDVLEVIGRRFAGLRVIVFPVTVQGDRAAKEIVDMLRLLERDWREGIDTVILTRGGGSYEDLQAFNDEAVARAIADLSVPLISAVGHEIDITIADLVADRRAPTPSAAAEMVVAERRQQLVFLAQLKHRLLVWGRRRLDGEQRRLQLQSLALERYRPQFEPERRRLQNYDQRLRSFQLRNLQPAWRRLCYLGERLAYCSPASRLPGSRKNLGRLGRSGESVLRRRLVEERNRLRSNIARLEAVNPMKLLARGYAVAEDRSGRVLSNVSRLRVGDELRLTLHQGRAWCRVEKVEEGETPS